MTGELRGWLDAAAGTDEGFARRAWWAVVRREPEPDALQAAVAKLGDGTLSRAGLLRQLVTSSEFDRVAVLDDALSFARAERARPREVRGPARPRRLRAPAASDERAIEIPWCLARFDGEARVLDVGYAFAEPAWLAGLVALGADGLVGVDLASADVPGLRSVVADVRELPFDDGSFELVYCVSTLEHVGRDNDVYAVDAPRDAEGDGAALRELRRVLADGGRLIVTVPAGADEDHGWQVVRTPSTWVERFERAGFVVFEDELYVHDADGWRSASAAEAAGRRYGEPGPGAGAVLLAELHPGSARERLRLAVRDVRHRGDVRRSTVS
ncbi:MAG TPA: methyltransferase domain-containing protein [Gaiellaceae bacterium]|nr:methyltransferase domain-containing protein [Gaiellaceae bacterium]